MKPSYRAQLARVRASYTDEKRADEARHDMPGRYVYRPLSFWITPFFLAFGWSANGVTVLSLGLALLLPGLALLGGLRGAGAVVMACFIFQVLDCVDGNIARTTGHHTHVGGMLDGLSSMLFWAAYFIAVGLLAQGEPHGLFTLYGRELGLGLALLLFMQRELEDTFAAYFDERVRWQPPVPHAPEVDLARWGRVLEHGIGFGGLLFAAVFARVGIFLALLATYQGVLFCLWLVRYCQAVRARSNEP